MTTFGGMTTAEWVTAISALVSAVFAIIAAIDPGSILSHPDLQTAVTAAFTAAVPILVAVWAVLHHATAATNAAIKSSNGR